MYKDMMRPVWAEINLSNLKHNIEEIKKKVGSKKKIIAVIKADGYGHGAVAVAKELQKSQITSFAVATLQEAINLRNAGISDEIIMLGLTPNMYVDLLIKYNITPVTNSYENALAINNKAKIANKKVSAFVAIDTGMGRIGYLPNEENAIVEMKKMMALSNFEIEGLFSHFATADAADKTFARLQESKFNDFCCLLESENLHIPIKTFANSAAVMDLPSVYFDAVRPGIILYGCYPSKEVNKENLSIKPVMSVKANIIRLKKVPAGFSVGYGRKFISSQESLIATIALGYADGYPRPFSNHGKVIINGVFAPLAGNICMDQCMIDVTNVPNVKEGDEVIIMGSDGNLTILADDIAHATETINYEIVCAFGQRLPKKYVYNK